MNKVMRGCRLRLYAVVAVSAALYVYPLDAVPHVVRSGHAPEGCSMKMAIPIWDPQSAFKPVSVPRLYLEQHDSDRKIGR